MTFVTTIFQYRCFLPKLIVHVYCIPLSTSINERITSFRPSQHLLQRKQKKIFKSVKFQVQTIRSFHTDCPFWLISSLQFQQFSGLSAHSKQSLATWLTLVRMAFIGKSQEFKILQKSQNPENPEKNFAFTFTVPKT